MKTNIRIYVDSNILINYCTKQQKDVDALDFVFSKRRKEVLFTSSLAIVQTISNLQTKKKTRPAFSREETIREINKLKKKFTIIDLTNNDIDNGLELTNKDIEDNIHYSICCKLKCDAILTNNTSDFSGFGNINVYNNNLSVLKSKIQ